MSCRIRVSPWVNFTCCLPGGVCQPNPMRSFTRRIVRPQSVTNNQCQWSILPPEISPCGAVEPCGTAVALTVIPRCGSHHARYRPPLQQNVNPEEDCWSFVRLPHALHAATACLEPDRKPHAQC